MTCITSAQAAPSDTSLRSSAEMSGGKSRPHLRMSGSPGSSAAIAIVGSRTPHKPSASVVMTRTSWPSPAIDRVRPRVESVGPPYLTAGKNDGVTCRIRRGRSRLKAEPSELAPVKPYRPASRYQVAAAAARLPRAPVPLSALLTLSADFILHL